MAEKLNMRRAPDAGPDQGNWWKTRVRQDVHYTQTQDN